MGGFQLQGTSGGLDVRTIVDQLLYVEAEPVRRMQQQEARIQQKIDAYKSFQTKLSDLAAKIGALNSSDNFAARKVTSSNEALLTASATSDATPGTYNIVVQRLALVDNFVSDAGFAATDAAIGTGSFDLTVGGETETITIDGSNNTLSGLKNAINNSGLDAKANIVNDGSGYRLTITSKSSGSENAISVDNNTLTLADLNPFDFSRTHAIGSAGELDALVTVNGLDITSSSNSVSGVVEGVTLNLTGTSTSTVSLTVSNDADQVKTAIHDFVEAYNDAAGFINSQFTFVSAANTSGVLSGDGLLRRVQSDLSALIRTSINGLDGSLTTLRSVGIEVQTDGSLLINESELDDNLDENFDAIQDLFLAVGKATNENVTVFGTSSNTLSGTYEVNITQAAEAAVLQSINTIPGTLGTDETLTFTLGSTTSIVNLLSSQSLDDIVEALNDQFDDDDIGLTASRSGDNLVVTSTEKGSNVSFSVVSDVDGAGTGFGTAGASDAGVDVAGTFRNTDSGETFAASGSGAYLTGSEGDSQGLSVQVAGSSTGTLGTVTVTLGYAELFERTLEGLTDEFDSPLADIITRLDSEVRTIEDDISSFQDRLDDREQALLIEFSRADQALRQLSTLQQTISSQLK